MDPFLRSKLTAFNDDLFAKNANEEFLSDEAKNLQEVAKNTNFIAKGYSKKTQAYKNTIQEIRQENYSAKWYEDGWYFSGKEPRNLINFYYTSKPDKGQNWFYKKNQLPYTDDISTGVYFNTEWSGLEDYFPISGEDSLSNMVLGGFVGTKYDRETFVFPYRNFNEFFDHKNIQVGDMGHKMFYDQINRYIPGEPIGYNRIFFQKGLSKETVNQDTNVIILSHSKDGLPFSARGINIETTGTLDNRKWFKRFESQNIPRFDVFFYSGDLNLISVPREETKSSYFGYGPIIQLNNPSYSDLANNNFSLFASGIYAEVFYKNFCCYNTGIATEEFYLSVSNPDVLEIKDFIGHDTLSFRKNNYYIWTDEDNGTNSGNFITSYKLGKNGNRNFELKINSQHLKNKVNQLHTEYVNIYRTTGIKTIINPPDYLDYGVLSEKFTFPVHIYLRDNGTKVTYSTFSEKNTSEQSPYINLGSGPFNLTSTGILGKKNNIFNIRFYSTGSNVKSNQFVRNDIYNRINKLGSYSGQNIRHIYPIEDGESYLNSNINAQWIRSLDNKERNFKWVQDNDNYGNDPLGNLKCEFKFKIDSKEMLPDYINASGRNYIVEFDQNINKFLFNGSQTKPKIFKNKNYRFLFTNFSDNKFEILNFNKVKFGNYKVYEPEQNKKLQNYKLIEFRVNGNNLNNLIWSGQPNGTTLTGEFEVLNNINYNPYYFSSGRAEYFIYNIAPTYRTYMNSFIPGSGQLEETIKKPIYTNDTLNRNSKINFYPYVNKKFQILNYKDDPIHKNPCRRSYNNFDKRFWYILTETELGCVSGCYSDEEYLKLLDEQYASKRSDPILNFTTGKYYHFIRPASTEKEFSSMQLQFFYFDNLIQKFKEGIPGVTINRETHLTNPDYLINTLGDADTKYFDHIYFYIPPEINMNDKYFYGLKHYLTSGEAIITNRTIYINNESNEQYSPVAYNGTIPKPIFSGDLKFTTSDLNLGELSMPLVLSGIGGFDYIRFKGAA